MNARVVCFGEVLLRFSTQPGRRIADAQDLALTVGGAEANVAVALAALGHSTHLISALPDNSLGNRALAALAGAGVGTEGIVRQTGRMGLYFLECGASLRPSTIIYDRSESAFARAAPEQFDFAGYMDGASLLHLSGITAALGPGGQAISRAAVAAAHAAGVPVSFDPNYRETLWKAWDSRPSDALRELADEADILFAGRRGMELLLGQSFSDKDLQDGNEMAAAGFSAFPRLQVIASMTRDPVNQAHQRLTARVDRPGESHQTREIEVPNIVDRIGTGDAFAAGVLDAWLAGADSRKMAETGLALGALKHGIYGDFCQVSRSELAGFTGRARDVLR